MREEKVTGKLPWCVSAACLTCVRGPYALGEGSAGPLVWNSEICFVILDFTEMSTTEPATDLPDGELRRVLHFSKFRVHPARFVLLAEIA